MSEMGDLYQEVIMDHNRNPRNYRAMDDATSHADGNNPLCGDHVTVFVHVDGDTVIDVSFTGVGCAISKSSASLMTQTLKGKSVAEAQAFYKSFHALITHEGTPDMDLLGKLKVFEGVGEFPARVKCATLAWRTVAAALEGKADHVSTE
jgi:nitrogen fixation NifU-like protein